jgi:hypothetical protein
VHELGWRNVSKLTQLRELTIAATPKFSAEGYADLAKLNNLTFLNVNANNNINEECLRILFSMTNLQALLFFGANVTDPGAYSDLPKMTKLRRLRGMSLTDNETMSYLAQVYSLTAIGFTSAQSGANEISAKYFSKLTEMQDISGGAITIFGTHYLSLLTNLGKFFASQQIIDENFPWQECRDFQQCTWRL